MYYILIRRLSNLLCHNPDKTYCALSLFDCVLTNTHKDRKDRPSLFSSILVFFQSTHLNASSFVFTCFHCPGQRLVIFPLHSPWPQKKSSIYFLTCAPLSRSRAYTLSLPYLFPPQLFIWKKKALSN